MFKKISTPILCILICLLLSSCAVTTTKNTAGNNIPDAAATELRVFNTAELKIIDETKGILSSSQFAGIRSAHEAGQPTEVRIDGRLIQFEPDLPASGMTMFGENGFLIGREAFGSEVELRKTILHELYRLTNSVSSGGISGSLAADETRAAFEFAEQAAKVLE